MESARLAPSLGSTDIIGCISGIVARPDEDTFMGRGTLHSPNQPSNHCTVRAQRRFERQGIHQQMTLVRIGSATNGIRASSILIKQELSGSCLPKDQVRQSRGLECRPWVSDGRWFEWCASREQWRAG